MAGPAGALGSLGVTPLMAPAKAQRPDERVMLVQDDPRPPFHGEGPKPRLEVLGAPIGLAHMVALQAGREEFPHRGNLARVQAFGGNYDDLHGGIVAMTRA